MMGHVEEINALLSNEPRRGPAGVALAEEAARIADVHEDRARGFAARLEVVSRAIFGGQPERALIAFAWCLARCDEDPVSFPERRVLWSYKWIAENLPTFAQFGRAQIAQTLDDMEQRYQRQGASLKPVYLQRARAAMALGAPPDEVSGWMARWEAAPRDSLADCLACDQNSRVELLLHVEHLEEAKAAFEVLRAKRMGCAEVPHITYALMTLPTWRAGDAPAARRYAKRALELCGDNRDFLRELAMVLELHVLDGQLEQAASLLERHLGWACEALETSRRLAYFLAAEAAVEGLRAARGEVLALRLSSSVPVAPGRDGYSASALAAWLGAQVDTLAAQYAARDGHDGVVRRVAAQRAEQAEAREVRR